MNGLVVTQKNGVRTIKFNKPQRKNALSKTEMLEITNILKADSEDNNIVLTILTGVGDYFNSGSDFKDIMASDTKDMEALNDIVKMLIHTVIDYPKLLVAVVNGPAIGIGTTILGLCDISYASDKATFHTPFILRGICSESCSSLLFPLILGRSRASEMILLAKKITVQEAEKYGLISRVIPHEQLEEFIEALHQYGTSLSVNSVKINKKLIVDNFRKRCHDSNIQECATLRSISKNGFVDAITKLQHKKSKM